MFDDRLLEYDVDYQNERAYSNVFQRYLKDFKVIIQRNFSGQSLIKVGCGKGYFLDYLHQAGYEITGIDTAYVGDNPNVIKARFEPNFGLWAKGIVLRPFWNTL